MRAIAAVCLLGIVACGQEALDENQNSEGRGSQSTQVPAAPAAETATALNPQRLAELIAAAKNDPNYVESRASDAQAITEAHEAIVARLGFDAADRARVSDILREHREARLRLQDLYSALATAGATRQQHDATVAESPDYEKARPSFVNRSLRDALGKEKLARYQVVRDQLNGSGPISGVDPGLANPETKTAVTTEVVR